MKEVKLSYCEEITTEEYCDLSEKIDLTFEGQTRADSHGIYWVVWKSNEELYKVKCSLNY